MASYTGLNTTTFLDLCPEILHSPTTTTPPQEEINITTKTSRSSSDASSSSTSTTDENNNDSEPDLVPAPEFSSRGGFLRLGVHGH